MAILNLVITSYSIHYTKLYESTLLKIIAGELDSTQGSVMMEPGERLSVLKQDHHAFDDFTILEIV